MGRELCAYVVTCKIIWSGCLSRFGWKFGKTLPKAHSLRTARGDPKQADDHVKSREHVWLKDVGKQVYVLTKKAETCFEDGKLFRSKICSRKIRWIEFHIIECSGTLRITLIFAIDQLFSPNPEVSSWVMRNEDRCVIWNRPNLSELTSMELEEESTSANFWDAISERSWLLSNQKVFNKSWEIVKTKI